MCNHWHEGEKGSQRRHKPGVAYKVFERDGESGNLHPPYRAGYSLKQGDTIVWNPTRTYGSTPNQGFCAFTSLKAAKVAADRRTDYVGGFGIYPVHKITFKQAVGTHNEYQTLSGHLFRIIILRDFTVGPPVYTPTKEATHAT